MNRAINRATLAMNGMHAFDCLPIRTWGREAVGDVNPFDDQDLLLELDLAGDISCQFLDCDLARCQRACKRSNQSPAGGGYHIVESGCVRLVFARIGAVMLSHRAMKTEADWLFFSW
jgi:hypothetical protein